MIISTARRGIRLLTLLLCVALCACAATGEDGVALSECGPGRSVYLPFFMAGQAPILRVRVQDVPVRFLLDTGAARSAIERRMALALGVMHDATRENIRDITGEHVADFVTLPKLDVGELHLTDRRVLVSDGLPFDGVIGLDILSSYALELDEAHASAKLHTGRMCEGQRPFTDAGMIEMPAIQGITDGHDTHLRVQPFLLVATRLDGVLGLAMFDSGAIGGSVVSPVYADKVGVTEAQLAQDQQVYPRGFGGKIALHLHRFGELDLDGEVFRNPTLMVSADRGARFQLVIGGDYFRTHRLWFDFAAKRVFSVPLLTQNAPGS